MYERDLSNRGNNDAVIEIASHVEDPAERRSEFRSRVTREGTMSFEIEIPRVGPTCGHRCCLYVSLAIPFFFLLLGIVPSVYAMVDNDAIPLYALIFTIGPVFVILLCLWENKDVAFAQTNLRITRNNYCVAWTGITWKSYFQIMFVPSHFDDFESGQIVETSPKEYKYVRFASLQAEIVTLPTVHNNSEWRHIELGSIFFASGLSDEEREWLVDKINHFLLETR